VPMCIVVDVEDDVVVGSRGPREEVEGSCSWVAMVGYVFN
jgi:hypothetical protein